MKSLKQKSGNQNLSKSAKVEYIFRIYKNLLQIHKVTTLKHEAK